MDILYFVCLTMLVVFGLVTTFPFSLKKGGLCLKCILEGTRIVR